jgi:copper oxidase (laccase) domain-containing protein
MSFSSGETAAALGNRARFLAPLCIGPRDLVMPKQVHGSRIQLCDNTHRGMGASHAAPGIADTDALVTRERGLAIGVMTADCMPVFIFDPQTPAVAIAHAGWRSTAARICALTVERMRGEF